MKAWLVLQEGPGAGNSYPLDPFKQSVLSIGRSSDCDVTLADQRASRHHGDIRWDGRHWVIADRGSTNGTYVNGMQVHQPYDLRTGDRITIGETTMVLREFAEQPATPARQPGAVGHAPPKRGPTLEGQAWQEPGPGAQTRRPQAPAASGELTASGVGWGFWLVQGFEAVAVVCLASGALLPWIKVTGSLSQDLEPMIQGIAEIVSILSGPESMFNVSMEIGGLEGYGKLTLGIALVVLITLVVDIFVYRKSVIPGIVYLVTGFVAIGAIGLDLVNYYRFYEDMQSLSLLFGVQLADVVQVFDQFIELEITPMVGLPLTGVGLVLLLVAGMARLVVSLVRRR
jgi:hypothetical protein